MLELKNNKHNTYYRCTYLYIVNAVSFKLLLTSYLKWWFDLIWLDLIWFDLKRDLDKKQQQQ